MKIYQPTISSSAYIVGLTTASQASVLTYDATTGQIFYTASSAIGGGGSGTPGGNNTEIQYNNAGAFGGVNKLKFDGTNLVGTGSFTGSFTGQFNGSITTAVTASYAQTLTIQGTLTDYASKAGTTAGPNNLFTRAVGSFTSAFGKYTLYSGSNSRAGEFVTSWNGTTTAYYDNATTDIGNTSAIIFESSIVTGNVQIETGVGTPSGWTIKMLVTYI